MANAIRLLPEVIEVLGAGGEVGAAMTAEEIEAARLAQQSQFLRVEHDGLQGVQRGLMNQMYTGIGRAATIGGAGLLGYGLLAGGGRQAAQPPVPVAGQMMEQGAQPAGAAPESKTGIPGFEQLSSAAQKLAKEYQGHADALLRLDAQIRQTQVNRQDYQGQLASFLSIRNHMLGGNNPAVLAMEMAVLSVWVGMAGQFISAVRSLEIEDMGYGNLHELDTMFTVAYGDLDDNRQRPAEVEAYPVRDLDVVTFDAPSNAQSATGFVTSVRNFFGLNAANEDEVALNVYRQLRDDNPDLPLPMDYDPPPSTSIVSSFTAALAGAAENYARLRARSREDTPQFGETNAEYRRLDENEEPIVPVNTRNDSPLPKPGILKRARTLLTSPVRRHNYGVHWSDVDATLFAPLGEGHETELTSLLAVRNELQRPEPPSARSNGSSSSSSMYVPPVLPEMELAIIAQRAPARVNNREDLLEVKSVNQATNVALTIVHAEIKTPTDYEDVTRIRVIRDTAIATGTAQREEMYRTALTRNQKQIEREAVQKARASKYRTKGKERELIQGYREVRAVKREREMTIVNAEPLYIQRATPLRVGAGGGPPGGGGGGGPPGGGRGIAMILRTNPARYLLRQQLTRAFETVLGGLVTYAIVRLLTGSGGVAPLIIQQLLQDFIARTEREKLCTPPEDKPRITVNCTNVKNRSARFPGVPTFQVNAYGAYNHKLPNLTVKPDAFANFKRSDPDYTRTMSDQSLNTALDIGVLYPKEQGMQASTPMRETAGIDHRQDQSFLLLDPYAELASIKIGYYNNATNFSSRVPVVDSVAGDLPRTISGQTTEMVSMLKSATTKHTQYTNIVQSLLH